MATHKELDIWKLSINLVEEIYKLTKNFPKEEKFGLTNQLRRAAVSVPSNIAEGAARKSDKENIQFLYISLGSLSEIETQLIIANRLEFSNTEEILKQTGITIETKDGVLRSQHLNGSSVDSWIFKTPLVLDFKSNYTLGRVSCDSCLNHQLKKSKFVSVYNPCRDVISIHEHNDWTPAKYQAVVDEQGVKRTLNEWTRHNLSNGDFLECIPFCSLADIG